MIFIPLATSLPAQDWLHFSFEDHSSCLQLSPRTTALAKFWQPQPLLVLSSLQVVMASVPLLTTGCFPILSGSPSTQLTPLHMFPSLHLLSYPIECVQIASSWPPWLIQQIYRAHMCMHTYLHFTKTTFRQKIYSTSLSTAGICGEYILKSLLTIPRPDNASLTQGSPWNYIIFTT